MWRWDHTDAETNPHDPNIRGMRPSVHQDYPCAMYKPMRDPKGVLCFEFDTAHTDAERANMESMGYVWGGKGAALKVLEAQETEIAKLAANRAAQERNMGERARAEAARVDDSTDAHVPVVPETPIKPRRGRKPKQPAIA